MVRVRAQTPRERGSCQRREELDRVFVGGTTSGRRQEPEDSCHRAPLDDGELNRSSGSCFCQVASGLSTPGEDQPPICRVGSCASGQYSGGIDNPDFPSATLSAPAE